MKRAVVFAVLLVLGAMSARAQEALSPETKKMLDEWRAGNDKLIEPLAAVKDHEALCVVLRELLEEKDGRKAPVLHLFEAIKERHPETKIPLLLLAIDSDERCQEAALRRVEEEFERDATAARKNEDLAAVILAVAQTPHTLKSTQDAADSLSAKIRESGLGPDRIAAIVSSIALERELVPAHRLLRSMPVENDPDRLEDQWARFARIGRRMSAIHSEDADRELKDLKARATAAYRARAAYLRALGLTRFLHLEAIAFDPSGERSRVIIRAEGRSRIYAVGDALLDKDGHPLEDLKVKKIEKTSVTFDVNGEFTGLELEDP